MEDKSALKRLDEGISQILQQLQMLKEENESLRNELISVKGQCDIKTQEIEKLTQLNAQKDQEIEEIVNKIESILG
ncbi:MAG: hypothetical protein FAF05_07210 [Epsilonproteobacteria bacterium]|nr:hypothetical protein [Campylobacterota bacterium]